MPKWNSFLLSWHLGPRVSGFGPVRSRQLFVKEYFQNGKMGRFCFVFFPLSEAVMELEALCLCLSGLCYLFLSVPPPHHPRPWVQPVGSPELLWLTAGGLKKLQVAWPWHKNEVKQRREITELAS